jgi:hypothetical protein
MTKQYRALIAAPPGLMRRALRAVLATFPIVELIGEADYRDHQAFGSIHGEAQVDMTVEDRQRRL